MAWSDVASKIRLRSRVWYLARELISFMLLLSEGAKVATKRAPIFVGTCGAVLFPISANAQVGSPARVASDLAFIPDINAAREIPSSKYGVQMKKDSAGPLQYFLDKAPNDIRASTLPTTANAVVLARVRLLGTAAGLGGADSTGGAWARSSQGASRGQPQGSRSPERKRIGRLGLRRDVRSNGSDPFPDSGAAYQVRAGERLFCRPVRGRQWSVAFSRISDGRG